MAKRNLFIDATILSALQQCPWKCYLSFVKHLQAKTTPEPIEKGSLMHAILEHFYVALKNEQEFKIAHDGALDLGRELYPSMNLEVSAAEWVLKSFSQYATRWRHDGLKVQAVEEVFMLKVYEDEELIVYYQGKIDLIATMPVVGLVTMDHKTRSRQQEETILNNQFMGYAIATGTSIVYVNEVGLQTSKKPEDKFRRIPLSYSDDLKEHWLKNLRWWVRQLDYYLQNDVWPEIWQPMQCKRCTFASVCKTGIWAERERKLMTEFAVRDEPWDVGKELETVGE